MPSLSLIFIVEPPVYQYLACYLAASIRRHVGTGVRLIGYCPAHRMAEIDAAAVETLRRMDAEVRPMETEGRFDPPYPHGNKLLACLEPRDTDWSGFMDSDILMISDTDPARQLRDGAVTCSRAASMLWAEQSIWHDIYGAFDMPLPEQRIDLMRRGKAKLPYFSSGFVIFPETHRDAEGRRFAETWMDTAQTIDRIATLPKRRPYLDQMSLPVAMQRAGLSWHELAEDDHYILGGKLRGKPLPEDRPITAVHYRKWRNLAEVGLARHAYRSLRRQVGTRKVTRIFDTEPVESPVPPGASA